jgi:hypothetical protein
MFSATGGKYSEYEHNSIEMINSIIELRIC